MAAPQRTPARRRRVLTSGALALLVGLAGVGAWQMRGSPPPDAPVTVKAPGAEAAPLCGVADVGRYSALAGDPPTDVVDTVVADFTVDGAPPHALAADGDDIVALAADDEGLTVLRLGPDGSEVGRFTSPTPPGGRTPSSFAPVGDGVVALPTSRSDQSAVVGLGGDGSTVWTLGLDHLGRGAVTAVIGWSAGVDGAAAAVAFADSPQLALISADGALVEPDGPEIGGEAFFPQVDGTLVARADDDDDGVRLSRWSAAGELLREFGGPVEGAANGGPAELERPTGVAVGPHGGLLVAGPRYRVVEVGDDGVWRRVGLSGQGQAAVFDFAEQSPLIRSGDDFYFVSSDEDGGASLSRVDVPAMDALLDSPVTYDINHASSLDRLGFGAGLVTDTPYGYFGPGEEPAVHVEFDSWWGAVSADYELRYRVTGDPWAEPPVEAVTGTLDLPEDGGRAALDLPPARPGPYDVHAELVDRVTGEVRTATCLRYAVGALGADFDPAGLADGADWGGAQPLRGVQLADQLGIGSYRVQLAFGDLVPDLGATPAVSALDLDALPGAEPDDPFAEIAEASAVAARSGVRLYVQVGQGGEAEHQAVQDGTWGAWAGAIAEAFAAGAPDVSLWAPWNEPNNTGFGDGGEYARDVLAPFAQAVKAAAPGAQVIGGNALNLVVPWYQQVIDAGGCASLDIVGIHPYTGFNRSWDEEGADGPLGQIEELNAALEGCGSPPVWNTESGWWSDGPGNHWAQGHDVARTLLWSRALGVEEWTYFFSEGGWGEGGFSWSLLQVDSFVKPGALAMATVAGLLEDRPPPTVVDAAVPHTHVMQVGERPGGDDRLTAVWTDDLVMEAQATADQDVTLTLTDVYGATREVDATADEPITLPVSGSPVFISAPSGAEVAITTDEPAGPNLLADGQVSASSTGEDTDPAAVIAPDGAGATPWRAGARTGDGSLDLSPWLQVDLPEPATIDRVAVESAGLRCCTSALREYTVSVQGADGEWTEVASSTGLFFERTSLVRFEPVEAQAVRVQVPTTTERGVRVPRLNYSGQTGGLHPAWSPVVPETSWPASVVSLAAYGPPS
ncbi:discoidin domain-containing protein [Cellulomonas cellasea]|uniref:discoidin domain-containing protein n=1 Tax=Cellulomonas cellasea TaxID=43670 RepID=UPI0025A45D34|nr:discoidin domain-containing protein [Cellulomonas cellasea]MDM8083255.1 discoidin domain-containing protein [Cellulomonas cellasea]